METGQLTTKEAFAKAASICSKSEKCSFDIRKKLNEWSLDRYDAEAVVEELKQEKFIDDKRYARAYVRDKFGLGKWGRVKIKHFLKQKGFSDDLTETALKEIDEEKYIRLLMQTLRQKTKAVKSKNRFDKMAKIIRYAQGRGFESEYIHRYIHEVVKD